MRFILSIVCVVLCTSLLFADGSKTDLRTGNHYSWTTDADGTTRVRGTNFQTGSTWTTTIEPDGDQRGTDKNGNQWRYNRSSKTYDNYGTGEHRQNGLCIFNCDDN